MRIFIILIFSSMAILSSCTKNDSIYENQKFKYLVKGFAGDDLPGMKRETIFIGILEAIHPQDAEHVLLMLEKKPPVKGMTKKIIEEAYPGLIRG